MKFQALFFRDKEDKIMIILTRIAAKFAFKSETHCPRRRSSHGDAGSISIGTGYSGHVVYWKLKNCVYTLGNIAFVIWTRTNEMLGVGITTGLASMWLDFHFKTRRLNDPLVLLYTLLWIIPNSAIHPMCMSLLDWKILLLYKKNIFYYILYETRWGYEWFGLKHWVFFIVFKLICRTL